MATDTPAWEAAMVASLGACRTGYEFHAVLEQTFHAVVMVGLGADPYPEIRRPRKHPLVWPLRLIRKPAWHVFPVDPAQAAEVGLQGLAVERYDDLESAHHAACEWMLERGKALPPGWYGLGVEFTQLRIHQIKGDQAAIALFACQSPKRCTLPTGAKAGGPG